MKRIWACKVYGFLGIRFKIYPDKYHILPVRVPLIITSGVTRVLSQRILCCRASIVAKQPTLIHLVPVRRAVKQPAVEYLIYKYCVFLLHYSPFVLLLSRAKNITLRNNCLGWIFLLMS